MTAPADLSQAVETLVVEIETAPGSGVFQVDPRLRVEEVRLGSDDFVPSASVSVRLDDAFDAFAARVKYDSDHRILIRAAKSGGVPQTVLLEGYPRVLESQWSGQPRRKRDEFKLDVVHVIERLSRDKSVQIQGRHMRNAEIEDGLLSAPATWQDKSVFVGALPCIFNANDRPNCSPTPLITADADGNPRTVYIFTYDDDFDAIPWTFLNAVRYLFEFHGRDQTAIRPGNLFEATEAFVSVAPAQRFSITAGGHLIKQLLPAADSFDCEFGDLFEALTRAVKTTNTHFTVDTVKTGESIVSQLRLWAAQDGALKSLQLARGGRYPDGAARFDARSKSAEQILAANNVQRGNVEWNFRTIVNAPIVLGDVKKYEFTVPLVPGWKPEPGLDNVEPADRAAAKAEVITEQLIPLLGQDPNNFDWYRKYHKFGDDFRFFKNVGRKWVLNEAGTYAPGVYNRNAPFDDYQPFEWSTVADDSIASPKQWARRKRKFFGSITRQVREKGSGVYTEVSFDSGANWYPMLFAGIGASLFEVGVYFGTPNLTSVTPPLTDPLTQNMWWAIIDQTFLVRTTGVIDSDERLMHEWPASAYFTPTVQVNSRVVDKSKTFLFVTREGVTNELHDPNEDMGNLVPNDAAAIAAFADEYAKARHDRQVITLPAIPWLADDYAIGDQIGEIQGRGISLATRIGHHTRYPSVVGVTYRLAGTLQTELHVESPDPSVESSQ